MNKSMPIFNMLRNVKDPKNMVINMLKANNNPMIKNLVEMAEKGDSEGVENFARNFYKQQGRDFDKEFKDFMSNFK